MRYYADTEGSFAWRVSGTTFWSIKIGGSHLVWTQAWNEWADEVGDYRIPTLFLLLRGIPE